MKTIGVFALPPKVGMQAAEIILCELHDDEQQFEMATWLRTTDNGARVWGHYFTAFESLNPITPERRAALRAEAQADFAERCKRGY